MVGAPDPVLGEIGVAFVVPTAGDAPADPTSCWPTLRAAARAALADYKAPDRVVVVDSLPLTSMMKVDKRTLADRARPSSPRFGLKPAYPLAGTGTETVTGSAPDCSTNKGARGR